MIPFLSDQQYWIPVFLSDGAWLQDSVHPSLQVPQCFSGKEELAVQCSSHR